MPIYEYRCQKCGTVFETIVSSQSTDEILCKNCGGSDVRKLISAAGIKVSSGKDQPGGCAARGGFT